MVELAWFCLRPSLVTALSRLVPSLGANMVGWLRLYVRIFPNVFVTKCFVALNSSNNLVIVLFLEGWLAYMRRNFHWTQTTDINSCIKTHFVRSFAKLLCHVIISLPYRRGQERILVVKFCVWNPQCFTEYPRKCIHGHQGLFWSF
jgi:hypothetical protein